jgi:hypothetical protein
MNKELTKGEKALHVGVITVFVLLYAITSFISMFHVVEFFKLSNSETMSWTLAVAYELGAAAALLGLVILSRLKEGIVLSLFIFLTMFQAMGNVYHAFANLTMDDIKMWSELFGLNEEPEIFQRRIVAIISGLPLPLIALGFIKSLMDYMKAPAKSNIDAGVESVKQVTIVNENPVINETPSITYEENIDESNTYNGTREFLKEYGVKDDEDTFLDHEGLYEAAKQIELGIDEMNVPIINNNMI